MSTGRPWSAWEDWLLRAMYPHCHTEDVAAWLGRQLGQTYQAAGKRGLRKSAEYLASDCAKRIQRGHQNEAMIASRLKPGHTPWNKGLKGSTGFSSTRFKLGSKPQTWKPVGTLRLSKDGYLQRKVTDTGYPPKDWQSVHAVMWSAAKGPIPPGHIVVFKPGKKTADEAAIRLEDLECITRAELMRRNSVHTKYPPEVARLVQLRGALNRQINKRGRAQEQA